MSTAGWHLQLQNTFTSCFLADSGELSQVRRRGALNCSVPSRSADFPWGTRQDSHTETLGLFSKHTLDLNMMSHSLWGKVFRFGSTHRSLILDQSFCSLCCEASLYFPPTLCSRGVISWVLLVFFHGLPGDSFRIDKALLKQLVRMPQSAYFCCYF